MSSYVELIVKVSAYSADDLTPPKESFNPEALLETRTWQNTQNDQREAVLYLVRDGLIDLLGRLDEWVPRSFHAESGNRMDVRITFDLEDIDNGVMLQQLHTDREMDDVAHKLVRMDEELRDS